MERLQKYLPLATFILVVIMFFKSCGTSSKLKLLEKENSKLNSKFDSISQEILTDSELKGLLENTVMWRTLEIEELSDKNKMPINHYKNELQK